jgi:integrase/recombinase XerD
MRQAKTLSERELKRVLDYIALHRHAARNRAMVMVTYYAGLRVSEVVGTAATSKVAPLKGGTLTHRST